MGKKSKNPKKVNKNKLKNEKKFNEHSNISDGDDNDEEKDEDGVKLNEGESIKVDELTAKVNDIEIEDKLKCDATDCNNDAVSKCGKCFESIYCSQVCQTSSWNLHKEECQVFEALRILSDKKIDLKLRTKILDNDILRKKNNFLIAMSFSRILYCFNIHAAVVYLRHFFVINIFLIVFLRLCRV
jgi:hypothetical protein